MSREAFEKIPEITQWIEEGKVDNLIFVPEINKYDAEMYITFTPDYVHYLNGAWMMYQSQQKRLQSVYDDCTEYTTVSELLNSIQRILQ